MHVALWVKQSSMYFISVYNISVMYNLLNLLKRMYYSGQTFMKFIIIYVKLQLKLTRALVFLVLCF